VLKVDGLAGLMVASLVVLTVDLLVYVKVEKKVETMASDWVEMLVI
jgi:hypothetical protein